MKKTLFLSSVFAAVFAAVPAHAVWAGGNDGGTNSYSSSLGTTVPAISRSYYIYDNRTGITLRDTTNDAVGLTPEHENTSAQLNEAIFKDGVAISAVRNQWGDNRSFEALTINRLTIGDGTGSASLLLAPISTKSYKTMRIAISEVNGTLSSVTNGGELTLGSAGKTTTITGDVSGNAAIYNGGDMVIGGNVSFDISTPGNYLVASAAYTKDGQALTANGMADSVTESYYAIKSYGGTLTVNGTLGDNMSQVGNDVLVTGSAHETSTYVALTGTVTDSDISGATNLALAGGNATISYTGDGHGGAGFINGAVTVSGGSTLTLSAHDALGYNANSNGSGNAATDSVTLTGTDSDHKAVLAVGDSQTMSADLYMNGFAEVKNTESVQTSINSFNGNIYVHGTDNVISTTFSLRKNVTIDVAGGSELEISGTLDRFGGFYGSLTKLGSGKLTISGNISGGAGDQINTINGNGIGVIIAGKDISNASFSGVSLESGAYTFRNTVKFRDFVTLEADTAISLSGTNSVLDLTGASSGHYGEDVADMTASNRRFINLVNSVSGDGTVKLGSTAVQLGGSGAYDRNITFNANYTFNGNFSMKNYSHGLNWTVSEGKTLTVHNAAGNAILQADNGQTLIVEGSVVADSITLGQNNWAGHLSSAATGSIKTGSIAYYSSDAQNHVASINLSGVLEFTDSTKDSAIYNNQDIAAVAINNAVLKADTASWNLKGSNITLTGTTIAALAPVPVEGGAEGETTANTNTITLNGVTLGGAITNNGNLVFAGAINYTGSGTSVTEESFTGSVSGFGTNTTTTTYKVLADGSTGSVSIAEGTTWTLNGNAVDYADGIIVTVNSETSSIWHVVSNDPNALTDVHNTATKVSVGEDAVLTISGTYDKNSKSIDNSAGGTVLVNGMTGYFHDGASMGNIKVGENGVTINDGYSRAAAAATTFGDIDAAEGATITFSGDYNATDMFHVTGTVSENLNIVNERSKNSASTMIFDNALNINSITAESGELKLKADSVMVNALTFGGGTLHVLDSTDAETTITTSVLNVNADSKLNANLVTTAGSQLYFNGTLTMGSTVEFGDGTIIIVSDAIAAQIANGDIVTLIDSIDADADITSLAGVGIYTGSRETGLIYITDTHVLTHSDGTFYVTTPEPATATLSLLALAALAARRKRH